MNNGLFGSFEKKEIDRKQVFYDSGEERMNKVSSEHYDGTTFKDMYPEPPRLEWDHSRGAVKNIPTRLFLQQVRECKQNIELLERRKNYRISAGQPADDLETEQNAVKKELSALTVTTADEISKIGNSSLEMVLTMRYIDLKSWDEIAEAMDLRIRTVLKFHGYGLVRMRDILITDGLIEEERDEGDDIK